MRLTQQAQNERQRLESWHRWSLKLLQIFDWGNHHGTLYALRSWDKRPPTQAVRVPSSTWYPAVWLQNLGSPIHSQRLFGLKLARVGEQLRETMELLLIMLMDSNVGE